MYHEPEEQLSEDFLDELYDTEIRDSGPDGLSLEAVDAKAEEKWLRAHREQEIKPPTPKEIARREIGRAKRRAGQKGRTALNVIRASQMVFDFIEDLLKDCGLRIDGNHMKRIRYLTQLDLDARIAWLHSKKGNLADSIDESIKDCEYLKELIGDRPYIG
jgi:hypothetical protein